MIVNFLPSLLMNLINQASVYIKGDNKYDMVLTVNVTIMMVLASIYLSAATNLPTTPNIKPVEIWLLFNLVYNFSIIMISVLMQVRFVEISFSVDHSIHYRGWKFMMKSLQKSKQLLQVLQMI